jgi:hypothetical protein
MKWHRLTRQQEQKSGAIVLIIVGLFMLFKGPGRLVMWQIPGAEHAPSFDSAGGTLMMAGAVIVVVGATMAWHAWARSK